MNLNESLDAAIKAAVHTAFDEREFNDWPRIMTLQDIETKYTTASGERVLKTSTLRAAILSGQLEAKKPGREYLVTPEALRAYLDSTSTTTPTHMGVTDLGTRPK